jgi:HEAT repeat protein
LLCGDIDLREAAADALGRLKDSRAFEPLIASLRDESWKMRVAATNALGKLGDLRAIKPLIEVLTEDLDSDVREAAADALGTLGKKINSVA